MIGRGPFRARCLSLSPPCTISTILSTCQKSRGQTHTLAHRYQGFKAHAELASETQQQGDLRQAAKETDFITWMGALTNVGLAGFKVRLLNGQRCGARACVMRGKCAFPTAGGFLS